MANRVSTSQMYATAQQHVAMARDREAASAEKTSSQKQITKPSQDPPGWLTANMLKDDMSTRETLAKNVNVAEQVLRATETVYEQAQGALTRAYELAVSQSGTNIEGPVARKSVLDEVQGIYEGFVQTLNFKYGNRTLLAGFKSDGPAFDRCGNFLGDCGVIEIDIDKDTRLPLTVSAEKSILGKGKCDGVNILAAFQQLIEGLACDDPCRIQGSIEPLKQGVEQISEARGDIGGRMQALSRAAERHASNNINALKTISKIEDADAISAFSDLARDQTVLHAAIQSTHKILTDNIGEKLFT